MNTAAILRSVDKVDYVYLLAIEGVRYMFASHHCIAGSGPNSWIGTEYGDRVVKPGLIPPQRLSQGKVDPWAAKVEERPVEFKLVDYELDLPAIFRTRYPSDQIDYLGRRLLPTEDPAPAEIVGMGQTPVPLWGRCIGNETFGPNGERRYYWLAPADAPPGAMHPAVPPQKITPGPASWAHRRVALYVIVRDPETGEWPSWGEQYPDAQLWRGTMTDNGHVEQAETGITWTIHCFGPESWKRKNLNTTRPTQPRKPQPVVELDPGQEHIAMWVQGPKPVQLQGIYYSSTFNAAVFHPDHALTGLTSVEELATHMDNVLQTTITGEQTGDIDPSTIYHIDNGDNPWAGINKPQGREARVSKSSIGIRMEADGIKDYYFMVCVMHAKAWAAFGYDVHAQPGFRDVEGVYGGQLPVGGTGWNAPEGANVIPGPGYYRGLFYTYDRWGEEEVPDEKKDNGGAWKYWKPMWELGTVILDANAGQVLRLGVGEIECAGQLAQPFPVGSSIDGAPVDSTGWWLFEGVRMDPGETEPRDYVQVALCSWSSADGGGAIAVDNTGYSSIRILRWEDPRRFGFDVERMSSPWVSTPESLRLIPMAVVGGIVAKSQDYAHHLIGRALLSTGTATWTVDPQFGMVVSPGVNNPPNLVGDQIFAGDREVEDLGCGIPHVYVDLQSIWDTVEKLPQGGKASPLNRVLYPIVGSRSLNTLWREILGGRGWAWSLKPPPGGGLRRYGVFDPVAPIGPATAEVTITDADILGFGRVDFRDGGPFDRFPFSVSRNPLSGDMTYSLEIPSLDEKRHLRGGSVPWKVEDGGLRKSSHFPGQAAIYSWEAAARERFARTISRYHAQRNFILTIPIKAHKVPDVGLGSFVWVKLERAPNPQGGYGLDHFGYVVELSHVMTGEQAGAAVLTLQMQERGVDDKRVWGPSAWGYAYDAQTGELQISENWAKLADHDDTTCFTEPEWSTIGGGPLRVAIWQSENGRDYPDEWVVYADVLAADPEAHTLTLANLSGGPKIFRDMYKWVTAAHWDLQAPGGWARRIFACNTRADGTFGDPPVKGVEL